MAKFGGDAFSDIHVNTLAVTVQQILAERRGPFVVENLLILFVSIACYSPKILALESRCDYKAT